jgi:hypothetical protein
MLSLVVRIANVSAFIVATWVALTKRVELIWVSLLDRPDIGVVILGDAGCVGIIGKL